MTKKLRPLYILSFVSFLLINLDVFKKLIYPAFVENGQKIGDTLYLGAPLLWYKNEIIRDCTNGCLPRASVNIDIFRLGVSYIIVLAACKLIHVLALWIFWRISIKRSNNLGEEVVIFKGFSVFAKDKVNNLDLRVEVSDGKRSAAYRDPIAWVHLDLYLNEEKVSGNLNIHELFTRLNQSGLLPLFTCTCGIFGCGGHYIDVRLGKDNITLKNAYAPNDEPDSSKEYLRQEFEYNISLKTWYLLLQDLLNKIILVAMENKLNKMVIGVAGTNVIEHLRVYQDNLQKEMRVYGLSNWC